MQVDLASTMLTRFICPINMVGTIICLMGSLCLISPSWSANWRCVGTQKNRNASCSRRSFAASKSSIVWRSWGICPVVFIWSYKLFASVTIAPLTWHSTRQFGVTGYTPLSSISRTSLAYMWRSVARLRHRAAHNPSLPRSCFFKLLFQEAASWG